MYAGEAAGIAHHQSLAVGGLDEDGSAEAANPSAAFVSAKAIGATGDVHIGVFDFPNGFSGALVQRNQVRLWIGPAVDVNEIAMDDGRGSSTPFKTNFTEITFPQFFPFEIKAKHAGGTINGDDPFTIGGW